MLKNRKRSVLLLLLPVLLAGAVAIDYVQAASRAPLLQQWATLNQIARLVRDNYVESVPQEKLIDGAIEGMLGKLDPHSTYITPEETKQVQERFEGEFEGIGIHFDIIDDVLTVLSPIPGSPAYKVGLQAGDKIVKIDGKSAIGIKITQVQERLKGPKGTQVAVSVRREGETDLLEFTMTRDKIDVLSVQPAFFIRPGVGYIWISRFTRKTAEEFNQALERLKNDGMKQLILDLRDNGGGYLDQAVEVAEPFVDKEEMIVYTQGRRPSSTEEHRARKDIPRPRFPVIVLINNVSASASEILAGALQDHDRALIVGQTSFGKGLVQNKFELQNGGAVLLTVARYYTPSGRLIQRPYTEDRLSYLQEAGRPAILRESVAGVEDTLKAPERPVFYTINLHRKVYGGGGIAPDVILNPDTLTAFDRRLGKENVLFEFANHYATVHRAELNDIDEFIRDFRLSEEDLAQITKILSDKRIPVDERTLGESLDFIRRMVMPEIALSRWGLEDQYRVEKSLDPQVNRAVQLFDQAKRILDLRTGGLGHGAASQRAPDVKAAGKLR